MASSNCLTENGAAKRVPEVCSSNARLYIREHGRYRVLNPRVPFLTTRLGQFYKRKPFTREALSTST
jgi:hypothetical protein